MYGNKDDYMMVVVVGTSKGVGVVKGSWIFIVVI